VNHGASHGATVAHVLSGAHISGRRASTGHR
jgi:hypothetical protein